MTLLMTSLEEKRLVWLSRQVKCQKIQEKVAEEACLLVPTYVLENIQERRSEDFPHFSTYIYAKRHVKSSNRNSKASQQKFIRRSTKTQKPKPGSSRNELTPGNDTVKITNATE